MKLSGIMTAATFFALTTCASPAALASPLTWDITGSGPITIAGSSNHDSGALTGSFAYDADTQTYSNINITTTSGLSFGGATYTALGNFASNHALVAYDTTDQFELQIYFAYPYLTDAGGTNDASFQEDACNSGVCTGGYNQLRYGAVQLTAEASSTPEPTSMSLSILSAISLLAILPLRRRNRAKSFSQQ